jgi:hypothetical protein
MCKERLAEETSAETHHKSVSACVFSFFYPAAAILLLPLFFCWFYFFTDICTRYRPFEMLTAVSKLGVLASWVSMPLMLLAVLGVRKLIVSGTRFRIFFLLSMLFGYAWLIAWNLTVQVIFSYIKAFFPICFCCAIGILPGFLNRYWIRDYKP